MARYVVVVPSPFPPEAAFARISDVTRFAEWDPGVLRSVRVAGDGASVGSAYELTVSSGGTTVMRYEVQTWTPPRRLVLVARTPRLTSVDEIRVDAAPEGSVVTYDATLTLNGPWRVFDWALGLVFRRIGDRAAAGLRRFLDAPGAS